MFKNISHYLLSAIRIQFFITLVSLPVLVLWSLPVSSLSIIGNLIFTPILALFLLLSSLIFFLEIAHLPNTWIIYFLEKLTNIWLNMSPSNPKQYLLFFPKNSWIIFLIALIIAMYVITYLPKKRQVLLLGLILISSCALAKLPVWVKNDSLTLLKRKNHLEIKYHTGQLIIYDHGILNQSSGIENWLNYTLAPALIKNFGTLSVHQLHLGKTSKYTCHNLELLQQSLIIEHVYQN